MSNQKRYCQRRTVDEVNGIKIWIVQELNRARFGLCKIWTAHDLDHARFGMYKIWILKNLDHALIGSCKISILQNLDCAKFGIVQDLDQGRNRRGDRCDRGRT